MWKKRSVKWSKKLRNERVLRPNKQRAQMECKRQKEASDAHAPDPPGASCGEPRSKRSRLDIGDMTDFIDPNICCTCFGSYDDDAGTGREWLQCQHERWMHEDCLE